MSILERLVKTVLQNAPNIGQTAVNRVCIGIHWTIVESVNTGITHTYYTPTAAGGEQYRIDGAGNLVGMSVADLAGRVLSENTLEASLGMAALKSVISPTHMPPELTRLNVKSWLAANCTGRRVVFVGRFPFANEFRAHAASVDVLEMDPGPGELPWSMAREVLEYSDINIITGTSLINHTLDYIIGWSRGLNALVGPSTPLHPQLFDEGIDVLAGIEVIDRESAFASVMQAASNLRQLVGTRPVVACRRPDVLQNF